MLDLSPDQKNSLKALLEWFIKDRFKMRYITMGGYAGTGKTTLIARLRKNLKKKENKLKVGFACYTGKAARILKIKLEQEKTIFEKDTVGTIHSLIYSPILSEDKEIIGWKQKDEIDRDLIIIDEASMVDEKIWMHLRSYGVPIIAVGDHGQLPPIKGRFNLMEKPDLILKKIHRQARNNPIIDLSIIARETGRIPTQHFSSQVKKYSTQMPETQELITEMLAKYNKNTLILCGYNHTRKKINNFIRKSLGYTTDSPQIGDRVICLRNNHKAGIYNGMLGTIKSIKNQDENWFKAVIDMDEDTSPFEGLISKEQFNKKTAINFTKDRAKTLQGDLFDFGYALTVHKAQGSQAKKVILFEERFPKMTDEDWRRWLYTGVTRSEEKLYIFA